jgi:hypothetical protein
MGKCKTVTDEQKQSARKEDMKEIAAILLF